MSRCQRTMQIAAVGHHPRFVERGPHRLSVIERAKHRRCVVRKPVRDISIQPSAAIVERRRKIPMEQRNQRLDAGGAQCIDKTPVKVESFLIEAPLPFWKNATPRNTESIGGEAEVAHECDVGFVAVIVIAGNVAGVAVRDETRRVTESMPDARPRAIGERRSFDLIRSGRRTPEEGGREQIVLCHTRAAERVFSSRWRVWRSMAFGKSMTTVM